MAFIVTTILKDLCFFFFFLSWRFPLLGDNPGHTKPGKGHWLVLAAIDQSLAAGVWHSLHMMYNHCCERIFTCCYLGAWIWCVWTLLCSHNEHFSWYLGGFYLGFSLLVSLQLVKGWPKPKGQNCTRGGKTGAQGPQEGVRLPADTQCANSLKISPLLMSFITYC